MIRHNLTTYELDCIRFYMGDPEIVERGDFIGGPKAYNTINALLHNGITNELDKISEGKPIEILNVSHLRQTVSLIKAIDSAMNKLVSLPSTSPLITYRADRISEIEAIKETHKIEGFYSTCKYGFLPEYANTKQNVLLLEIQRDSNVPFLDFELLFQDLYAKPQESEILLPFDTIVKSIKQQPLTEEENKLYHDMHGNKPCAKYRIILEKRKFESTFHNTIPFDKLTSQENASRISHCLQTLTRYQTLNPNDLEFYLNWKTQLKSLLL